MSSTLPQAANAKPYRHTGFIVSHPDLVLIYYMISRVRACDILFIVESLVSYILLELPSHSRHLDMRMPSHAGSGICLQQA